VCTGYCEVVAVALRVVVALDEVVVVALGVVVVALALAVALPRVASGLGGAFGRGGLVNLGGSA